MTRAALQSHKNVPSPHRGRLAVLALGAALSVGAAASAEQAGTAVEKAAGAAADEQAAAPPVLADTAPSLQFEKFDDKAFLQARKSGAPVVLYFEADWCAPCKKLHEQTFREPAVLAAAAGIRFFRVDMTKPDGYVDLVQKSFKVIGAPTLIVFEPGGKERTRSFGFVPPTEFAKMLGESRTPPASS